MKSWTNQELFLFQKGIKFFTSVHLFPFQGLTISGNTESISSVFAPPLKQSSVEKWRVVGRTCLLVIHSRSSIYSPHIWVPVLCIDVLKIENCICRLYIHIYIYLIFICSSSNSYKFGWLLEWRDQYPIKCCSLLFRTFPSSGSPLTRLPCKLLTNTIFYSSIFLSLPFSLAFPGKTNKNRYCILLG